jgi:predicted Fe-Mo cluster-binding NifX family protein
MKQAGIETIVTDIGSIEEAVRAYLEGTIVDHTDRLH